MSYEEFLKLLKCIYGDNVRQIQNIKNEIDDDDYVYLNNKRVASLFAPFLLILGNMFGINVLTSSILAIISSKLLDDYTKNSDNDKENFDDMMKAYDQSVELEYLNNYNHILINNMTTCDDNHHLIIQMKSFFKTFTQKDRYILVDNTEFLRKIKKIIEAKNYKLLCSYQDNKIDYQRFGLESLFKSLIFALLIIIMMEIGFISSSSLYVIQFLSYYFIAFFKSISAEKHHQQRQSSFLKKLRHKLANNEYLDVDNDKLEDLFNEVSLIINANFVKHDYVIDNDEKSNNYNNIGKLEKEVVKSKKLML